MATLPRRLTGWVFPEGALLAGAVFLATSDAVYEPVAQFAPFFAVTVFALGLLLGLRVDNGRLVFALLALGAAERALALWTAGAAPTERVLFQGIAILLPLNLAILPWTLDRGVRTPAGARHLAALGLQGALLVGLARAAGRELLPLFEAHTIPRTLTSWTPVGDLGLVMFAFAALLLGASAAFESGPARRPWTWALAAAFLALQQARPSPATTVYLAAGGLMLVLAAVEASFVAAYHDGLTGLPGRRALTEALQRIEGPWALAMADVDHFKRLNDTYGHDTGDQVLRMVASRLARVRGGTAYRYGGEEFALLFPGKNRNDVVEELERLREDIAGHTFATRARLRRRRKPAQPPPRSGSRLTITVSMGVADGGKGATSDDVLRAADKALYKAKEEGRNRVAV